MTRHDITARQAELVYAALVPTLGFLTQLEEQLGEFGLAGDDAYVVKLKAACDAYRAFTCETMRLARTERGGRPAGYPPRTAWATRAVSAGPAVPAAGEHRGAGRHGGEPRVPEGEEEIVGPEPAWRQRTLGHPTGGV